MSVTEQPAAEQVRILGPDGVLAPTPAAEEFLPFVEHIPVADVEAMYRDMVRVRHFDREGTHLQRQGQLALYVPAEGQEAAQIGSAYAMRPQDAVFPSYREHGVGLVRGIDLVDVLRVFRGATNSGWSAEGTGFRPYTLVIGSQTLHATGYAMGQRYDGAVGTGDPERDEATIVYFGDGATSQGDTNEAFVFATSYQTPQLFFLQNNQWAISVPVSTQSRTPLVKRAEGFGLASTQIDGNDLFASYAVSRKHLEDVRAGRGPAFIEAVTYRMGAHTTSDDPTKYRTREEEEAWRRRDPIARVTAWLVAQGAGDEFFATVEEEAKDFASDIRRRLLEAPDPVPTAMFDHVYSEPHAALEAQREWFERYEASFGAASTEANA